MVHTCPEDLKDVIEASQQLGCRDDSFGNNQYMCIPNKEKTSLVQFCYDGIMGIQEKGFSSNLNLDKTFCNNVTCMNKLNSYICFLCLGNCLEANVSNGTLFAQSCRDFLNGCPSNYFWNHQVYQCKNGFYSLHLTFVS